MSALFADRQDAGRRLAARLQSLAGRSDVVVLALPRGGVPVAAEVAAALGAPLDVFVVRKLGVPGHEELAMGAVASGGVRVVNQEIVHASGVSRREFDDDTEREQREVERRERTYRGKRPFPNLRGATVLLIDDGVATGSTMMAGVLALRQHAAERIIAAAPVMAREAALALTRVADQCVYLAQPEPFFGVAMHYQDFGQTTDAEVLEILAAHSARSTDREVAHAART
jgi:predicted phosphoribosyltransferase